MKLYVKYDEHTLHYHREDKDYGDWEESLSFSVDSVHLSRGDDGCRYEEFEVAFDAKVGDTAAVLYMTYSTGDSFGSSDGNGEVLWVFPDGDTAVRAMRKVQTNIKQYSIEFDDGFGNKIVMNNPAAGYFEHLENIDINVFVIKE